jgi:hypothetical protein
MAKSTTLKEDFTAASQDVNGGGAFVPDPVNTGDTHADRMADNTSETDAPVAHVPGIGDVPQASVLKAIIMKLGQLPPEVLATIANELEANTDIEANPTGNDHGNVDQNFASILSTNEDVEEIFAGQDLTEEFKEKVKVVFEAAVGARVAIIKAELEDTKNEQVTEAIQEVTDQIVDKIDKYLTFAAEEYVTENKVEIEQTIETTIAEQFMKDMFVLASKYNINVPEQDLNVVEDLTTQVETLTTEANKNLEALVDARATIKEFESKDALNEATKDLTDTQRARVAQLAENVEYESGDQYRSKLGILVESVATATAPEKIVSVITEENKDGVALLTEEENTEVVSSPVVQATLKALKGWK